MQTCGTDRLASFVNMRQRVRKYMLEQIEWAALSSHGRKKEGKQKPHKADSKTVRLVLQRKRNLFSSRYKKYYLRLENLNSVKKCFVLNRKFFFRPEHLNQRRKKVLNFSEYFSSSVLYFAPQSLQKTNKNHKRQYSVINPEKIHILLAGPRTENK